MKRLRFAAVFAFAVFIACFASIGNASALSTSLDAVTYPCNNRCLFCYAGCGGGSCGQGGRAKLLQNRETDTIGLKRIIDIFRQKAKIPSSGRT
ncbi:MAG: hypothetical protein WBH66_03135 [Rectinemataceae bacterium]